MTDLPRIKPRGGQHTTPTPVSDAETARAIVRLVDQVGWISLRDLDSAFPGASLHAFVLAVRMIEGGQ
jgi:hypothetical protein